MGQGGDGAATGVDGTGAQPSGKGETGVAVEGEQREVLVLLEVTVEPRQNLLAVRRVVGGVQVDGDHRRRPASGADEQLG